MARCCVWLADTTLSCMPSIRPTAISWPAFRAVKVLTDFASIRNPGDIRSATLEFSGRAAAVVDRRYSLRSEAHRFLIRSPYFFRLSCLKRIALQLSAKNRMLQEFIQSKSVQEHAAMRDWQ